MKKTIFIGILMACIMTSAAVYGAWAQAETQLGIEAGDNFTYSFQVFWSSADSNVVVPQMFSDMNNTLSIHFNATDVSTTMANLNITRMARDGTQTNTIGYVEVLSGRGVEALLFIIRANLTAGDQAYPASDPAAVAAGAAAEPFKITDTLSKTYLGTSRVINHYTERVTNTTTGNYVDRNAYYEKETGILMEMTITHYFADVQETDSEHWKITQFNSAVTPSDGGNDGTNGSTDSLPAWVVPAVIAVVVIVAIALVAALMLRRRGKPKAQAETPSQMTPPQTPV
jgi:hypothetical protein